MSYSDDVILTVAKDLFISRVEQRNYPRSARGDEAYEARLTEVACDFSTFVHEIRQKLKERLESEK